MKRHGGMENPSETRLVFGIHPLECTMAQYLWIYHWYNCCRYRKRHVIRYRPWPPTRNLQILAGHWLDSPWRWLWKAKPGSLHRCGCTLATHTETHVKDSRLPLSFFNEQCLSENIQKTMRKSRCRDLNMKLSVSTSPELLKILLATLMDHWKKAQTSRLTCALRVSSWQTHSTQPQILVV